MKTSRITGTLHEDPYTFLIITRWILLRMRNVLDKIIEKIKTTILWSIAFCRISCHLWYHVEKYCTAGQATDHNMAHSHCMLNTCGYKYTLTIRNTYCLSTATVVARTRLSITLYVLRLSNIYVHTVQID